LQTLFLPLLRTLLHDRTRSNQSFPTLNLHSATGGQDAHAGLFSSHIRNPNTRRAYMEAVRQFSAFCAELGILDLAQVEPIHVAAFVEAQLKLHSKPR